MDDAKLKTTAGNDKKRRRTQTERSQEMRGRLAEAAYQVIAERGHGALRMAAVAETAQVSQGALLHHYPDKDSVTLAAIRHALTIARVEADQRLSQAKNNPEMILTYMLEDFRSFFLGDQFWVALGITLDASKTQHLRPSIREIVSELRHPVYAQWADRLVETGWPEKRALQIVRSGSSLVSGGAIRTLWAELDNITEDIEKLWLADILAEYTHISSPN